jgi:hypothetical protein
MEAITIRPKNKQQLTVIEAFLKALKVPFEKAQSPYNPEFVKKILQGDKDLKEGKGKKITIDELNKLWK